MSEPVGNSPRSLGDVPNNSHKERKALAEEGKEPREKAEKIVTGKVITKKTPWYKRFARSMVADDATSIGDYLLTDVFVPAFKNLIRDSVVGATDRTLFGSRGRNRSVLGGREGLRTRYDQISQPESRRALTRESRARHDFDDVVLESRAEAVDVVEALFDRVSRFGSASVSDLYDFVGVTGSYADQRWGWTNLQTADVRQVPGGFLLDLPRPDPLR